MAPESQVPEHPGRHPSGEMHPRKPAGFWRIPFLEEVDSGRMPEMLRERIKELNALYALARIAEARPDSMEEPLRDIVEIIPPSWQYSEITRAKIILRGQVVQSPGYCQTPWRQSSPISLDGVKAGEITVCYLEERPQAWEGPFLQEERILLNAIAERIGCMALRISVGADLRKANEDLLRERQTLLEKTTALKVILSNIEEEKDKVREDVHQRVEIVLKPLLYSLYLRVPGSERKYLDLILENLEDLSRPVESGESHQIDSLTVTELQICHLIRNGLRTKEIAALRDVSPNTICRHRDRIRRKLGLAHKQVNLATYLKNHLK